MHLTVNSRGISSLVVVVMVGALLATGRSCMLRLTSISRSRIRGCSWAECSTCCSELSSVLTKFRPTAEPNLVCFDVQFFIRTRQHYTVLTSFAPHFSFYLRMAQDFLLDAGSNVKLSHKIVWRLEDNSTIQSPLVLAMIEAGVAVVAHSIEVTESVPPSFTTWVPNFHFIEKRGFSVVARRLSTRHVPYTERKRQVIWAGSTTGVPCYDIAPCVSSCNELDRVKLVRYFSTKNITWLNLRLSNAVQWCHGSAAALRDEGLLRDHVQEDEWAKYRGVLDIDGNVDAWGLRWRLESGSVVFLVKSSYEHFFSNSLVDGTHYVGIDANFDNLKEKTTIVYSQEVEDVKYLENVANNAKLLMRELSYQKVTSAVARALLTDEGRKE